MQSFFDVGDCVEGAKKQPRVRSQPRDEFRPAIFPASTRVLPSVKVASMPAGPINQTLRIRACGAEVRPDGASVCLHPFAALDLTGVDDCIPDGLRKSAHAGLRVMLPLTISSFTASRQTSGIAHPRQVAPSRPRSEGTANRFQSEEQGKRLACKELHRCSRVRADAAASIS